QPLERREKRTLARGHADVERRRRHHERIDVALPRRPRRLEAAGDEAASDQAAEAVAEEDDALRRLAPHVVEHRGEIGGQIVFGSEAAARARARTVAALVVANDAPAVRV